MTSTLASTMNMSSVFPGGMPQSSIVCQYCSKHFLMCDCTGLGHGQGMYFALPKVPDSMSKEDRLERFTVLVQFHPCLQSFAVKQFLTDQGGYSRIVSILAKAEPILIRLMEAYKGSTEFREGHPMNRMDEAGRQQVRVDCDLAIHSFLAADWGQIKLFEWIMLNNAIQTQSNPEDFPGANRQAIQVVIDIVSTMMDIYNELKPGREGANNMNFQLEDILAKWITA